MTLTPHEFRAQVRAGLSVARARREVFLGLRPDAPAAEVVDAFDAIQAALDGSRGRASVLSAVHPDKALREAAEELEQELVAFATELSLDRDVYDRLAAVPAGECGDPLRARLLAHSLRDYRRSGVDRDQATRERVRALQDELVEIGQAFDRNIIEGGRELVIDEGVEGLAGLPDDYRAAHPVGEDGKVRLSTDAPDWVPFMLYAQRADLRERFYLAYQNRAHPENAPVLAQLRAKRHELARLLGYESWGHYITEDKMVRDPDAAREFIERVAELARPQAEREYAQLLEEKRKREPDAQDVFQWEAGYLVESVKRSRFGFDSQQVRPYFAYARVEQGLLRLSERLYGVELRRVEDPAAWHADVRSFEVLEHGRPRARFHLDMFPREGKYKHAAMFDVRRGRAGESMPVAVLACNFPRPQGDDPGLLMHSEVTTFFHEFGHLLHGLFAGGQRYDKFSGIECERDFVEVPSQLFEEWAWDPAVLATFAVHHESGEPIPAGLIEKLRAAEEYGKALGVLRQMVFARLSLACFEGDPAGLDLEATLRTLTERMTPVRAVEGTHMTSAFGHLNGYSAVYYTYMWSLVIAKDFWSVFAGDPLEPSVSRRYRETVLAPGGARDARDMARDFLGREYGMAAWEEWLAR